MKKVIGYILLILFIVTIKFHSFAETENLIKNSSFEDGTGSMPGMWNTWQWDTSEGTTQFDIDTSNSKTGNRCVMITNNRENDARFTQKVSVEENSIYRFSCWVRTENAGTDNKGANISIEGRLETSIDLKGTNDTWQEIELYIKTGEGTSTLSLTLGLGGYGSTNTGRAYFDDVQLVKVSEIPQGARTAVLEEKATTSPDTEYKRPFWLLILALLAALGTYLHYRNKKNNNPDLFSDSNKHPSKGENEKKRVEKISSIIPEETHEIPAKNKPDKKDLLIMGIMTFVYLIIALINLGGFKSPEKGWTPAVTGEYAVFDLGREVVIDRVTYYCGRGSGWYASGSYILDFFDSGGHLVKSLTLQKDNVFLWKYENVNTTARTMKITVDSPNGELSEISIFDRKSKTPLEGIAILESEVSPDSVGGPLNLIDEPNKAAYAPSYMNGTYFDEIYHARTAYEYLHNIEPFFENTHPPLGKIFISIGIMIFGMNPFGWRIVGTLFGAAMIPLMYMFGKKIFGGRFYAFCLAFLMMFDFMHFAQTRIATIDVYVTFFVIFMFYYMYDYFMIKTYKVSLKEALRPLFLSGLMFGLGAASKWIALYGGAGLALIFFLSRIIEYLEYNSARRKKHMRKQKWIQQFIPNMNKTFTACVVFFVVIPLIIYILSYIPYIRNSADGSGLEVVYSQQKHMYNYHSNLEDQHTFSSQWYQWPVMSRPVWYYLGSGVPSGMRSTIASFGNPAIWWTGIVAFFASLVLAIKKRDKKMVVIFIAIAAQYLPWVIVPRIAFLYHFFSIIPFIMICIVYVIKFILEKYRHTQEKYLAMKYVVYGYLALVLILFVVFYPVLSGMVVPEEYVESLRWGKGWYF